MCGASFEYYPSEKEGVFCSECVENKTRQESQGISGPDHPRWNGGPVQLSCDVCGDSFERHPSSITGEATLCGDECRAKWLSDAYTGKGHPHWNGGGNGPYGRGWTRVRREAFERDGYQCVICSKTKEEIGRNPDVHHIIWVRVFVESDTHEKADAPSLENVVSLCVTCHRKADFGHIPRTELHSVVGIT